MIEQKQSFTYHSLHRHVQSILPQSENKQFQTIYSSNKQPQLPSILSRSRQKKSHQKSLKKGISRVSKSKKDLYENTNLIQTKQVDTSKSLLSKGTLLNFNLQQVVENKYHLSKPKDQLQNKSPLYTKIGKQQQRMQKSSYEEGQRSFMSEYRIVTYVPAGYMEQKNLQQQKKSDNPINISKQLFKDKENNLNESNLQQRGIHKKNDSQQIHITNPIEQNNFQLNTWRTSQNNNNTNNDPYYSSNLKQQLQKMNTVRNDYESSTLYVPFQQRYSIPLTVNIEQIGQKQSGIKKGDIVQKEQQEQLKRKIQHLQHEIVDIQREKSSLIKENNQLRQENNKYADQHQKMVRQLQTLYPTINQLEQKVSQQQNEISKYKYQLALIQQQRHQERDKKLSQSQIYQQQQHYYGQQNQQQQQTNNINYPYFNYPQDNQQHQSFITKIHQLQVINATLSRQLSQKTLLITQLNGRNYQIMDKLKHMQTSMRQVKEKLQQKEEQLMEKNKIIDQLQRNINRNNKRDQTFIVENNQLYHQQHHLQQPLKQQQQQQQHLHQQQQQTFYEQKYKQLSIDFEQLQQRYQQKIRDYNHLQKKHNFMKDQLQHLKYMQNNINVSSSSYKSVTSKVNNNSNHYHHVIEGSSIHDDTTSIKMLPQQQLQHYEQYITSIQSRLQITQKTLVQTQHQYNNLKQNFRALQQLYIKQQQQFSQTEKQFQNLLIQNKQLKKQLITVQDEINKKSNTILNKQTNESQLLSLKLIEKQQQIIKLKRQLNSLQMDKYELIDQKNYLKNQLQQINQKYLKQLQKNTQFSIRYKEDIAIYTDDVQKQQQQKTSLIVMNYQTLITKLNQQILLFKQQLGDLKDKHVKEMLKLQDKHMLQLEKLNTQRYERQHDMLKQIQAYQNRVNQQKIILQKSHRVNFDTYLNDEIQARKQLELINIRLQQNLTVLQTKYKQILIEKDKIQDQYRENIRKLSLFEQDITFYKDQKDILAKQKQQIYNELQRANTMIMELKKVNSLFEEQRFMFNRQLDDLSAKYTVCIKENQNFIDEVKILKKRLTQKQFQTDNYDSTLRELRIALLQEKQSSQKRFNMIESLKVEIDNHRSKQEYYKMLYEKSQRQIQLMKQQISLLMLEKEKLSLKSSPIKVLSPVKTTLKKVDQFIQTDSIKDRETQLYRIEIYKDLNTLLNLTLQNFTLEQVLQKNQQQYLRKLYNAIKEDHDKLLQLKQLIVAMQEGFKQQKILIKQDYDLVYEKYLKYKSMCQDMQKDIEKYKLKLKKKDENFASIKI